MSFLGLVLMPGCSSSEDSIDNNEENVPTVKARFIFSFDGQVAGRHKSSTRMDADVVQNTGDFRGISDVRMLCFNQYPNKDSKKIGKTIEMKTTDESVDVSQENDYSEFREVNVPVGTNHFSFYAKATDDVPIVSHLDKMKYGLIETVGLSRNSYQDNSGIRFKPVPICSSDDPFGGSAVGLRLFNLLNDLMSITVSADAPNNKWSTANSLYLNEAYQRMKQLKTLSSYNVQTMLAAIYQFVDIVMSGNELLVPDDQCYTLASAIATKIAECFTATPTSEGATLTADYQGFPADIYLPAGAARVTWDETTEKFVVPAKQAYGKELDVLSINDYVYPMNLQYQVLSDIVASDEVVVMTDTETGGGSGSGGGSGPSTTGSSWQEMINDLYDDAPTVVSETTRSVAMVNQVNYAVGQMELKAMLANSILYDANGQDVDVSDGFTLKGYIVGGQCEVDYNFQPVEGSRSYAIYDIFPSLGNTPQKVTASDWTEEDYILGMGTGANENIYLALELVNDCADFQGADGVIAHGATFYLVANLAPSEGVGYSTSLNQIFDRDHATKVKLTINQGWRDTNGDGVPDPDLDNEGNPKPLTGLATATYGLPNLEIPHPTVGLSVNLLWERGLYYDDVVLSRYIE